jgi:hypothetical protein
MNKYNWCNRTRENLIEIIEMGDCFCFQFRGKDYLIDAYEIQNPDVQEDGSFGENPTLYPESSKVNNSTELFTLRFLDGKTILEAYDELKFFD